MAIFPARRINDLTYNINGGAIDVHRRFGPGLFESGLLMNFNVPLLTGGGIKRLVNPSHDIVAEDEFRERAGDEQ